MFKNNSENHHCVDILDYLPRWPQAGGLSGNTPTVLGRPLQSWDPTSGTDVAGFGGLGVEGVGDPGR